MLLPVLKTVQRRNNFIGLFFALFFVIYIGSEHIVTIYLKSDIISDKVVFENFAEIQPASSNSPLADTPEDFYVPAIAVIKTGVLNPGGGGVQRCTIIDYTYEVTNQSTDTDEVLENVTIFEPSILGFVAGPDSGDDGDGLLEDGETWIYKLQYNITPVDKVAAQVGQGII